MAPLSHALILTLVLVQSLHVYCQDDIIVRQIPGVGANLVYKHPINYRLEFSNDWYSEAFNYKIAPLELRCFALLYSTPDDFEMKVAKVINLDIGTRETLQLYIPHNRYHHWRIQCDYWYRVASEKARRAGLVLMSGQDEMCLVKNGGCIISFVMGEVRRISRQGTEFLGELPEVKCSWSPYFCEERSHPRFMFGLKCPGSCDLPVYPIADNVVQ